MVVRILHILTVIFLFLIVLIIIYAQFIMPYLQRQDTSIPKRIEGIPLTAVWSGGWDGGNWYDCHPLNKKEYQCSIYNDYTGSICTEGIFTLGMYYWDKKLKKRFYFDFDKASIDKRLKSFKFSNGGGETEGIEFFNVSVGFIRKNSKR